MPPPRFGPLAGLLHGPAAAALPAATLLAATLLVGCSPDEDPPTAGELMGEGVEMLMVDMETFLTRDGIRRARLEADTAEFREGGEVHMRPVTLVFFDEAGREGSELTAERGIYYEASEDMEAFGNILVVDRREDRRLETERLRYTALADELRGDVAFTLTSDGGRTVVRGASFVSDPGLDSVTVLQPAGRSERRPSGSAADTASVPAADTASVPATDSTSVEDAAPPDSAGSR